MPSKSELEALLVKGGISLAGPIVSNQDEMPSYLAFVKAKFMPDGRREPSAFALNKITASALGLGIQVSFVLIDGERDDLDGSIKTMLFGKFPDAVRNSFSTFAGKTADIWIEPKQILDATQRAEIERAISAFLGFLNLTAKSINITQAENIPTPTALLRTVRICSPCSAEEITQHLSEKDFVVPNRIWLDHSLDKLRKSGVVLRKKNGQFILTLKGLSSLGTSKNRQSPDVVRALAIARKGR
jgi:hypothetical protein